MGKSYDGFEDVEDLDDFGGDFEDVENIEENPGMSFPPRLLDRWPWTT